MNYPQPPTHPHVHPEPGHGLPVWHADRPTPERYGSSVGGDEQLSDVWFVRLVNDENHSTVDINVYMAGFCIDDDGKFAESGIEVAIEWQEWKDADHTIEGILADISYESGNALAYDPEDWGDVFNSEARRIAQSYIDNAADYIWWDGKSLVNH